MRLTSLLILCVLLATSVLTAPAASADRPNIVFFLVDDLGYKDASFMGSKYYETPNMDSLAASGLVFTNGYANASNCAPTRGALMSGQYAQRTGIYTVNSSARGAARDRRLIPIENTDILPQSNYTLGDAMHDAGYATASMGKWHLGEGAATGPLGQGFDKNVGGGTWGQPPNGSYFTPYGNKYLTNGKSGEYLTDRLTDEAVKFIEDNKDTVFFLYLPHYAVHTPVQAKAAITAKYKNKTGSDGHNKPVYAAMIESVDQSLGSIVEKLRELDIYENTLIVLTSDNGGHGEYTKQLPLRGSKGYYYEGGIRVPWVWSWPGTIAPGVCDVPIQTFDTYPTFVNLAKASVPADKVLDGVDLSPLLLNTGSISRESIFFHFPAYLQKYNDGSTYAWRAAPLSVIRTGDFKLMEFYEYGQLELYNLKNDIGETTNLALDSTAKYADTVKKLRDDLHRFLDSTNAPIPTTLNKAFVARAVNSPGKYITWDSINKYVTPVVAAVAHTRSAEVAFSIHQAAQRILMRMTLPRSGEISLRFVDLQGRELYAISRKNLHAGTHELQWMRNEASAAEQVMIAQLEYRTASEIVKTSRTILIH